LNRRSAPWEKALTATGKKQISGFVQPPGALAPKYLKKEYRNYHELNMY